MVAVTNELGSGKKVVLAESRYHPGIYLGGTDENHEEPLRIAGVSGEIRIKHFPNTSLERYFRSEFLLSSCDFSLCSAHLPTDVVYYFSKHTIRQPIPFRYISVEETGIAQSV
jgi:hypothetical protein